MRGLLECPMLTVLDLQDNRIEDVAIIDLLKQLPNLKVLYLKGNPVVEQIKNYRKIVISTFPKLTYLDDRPVFPDDRRLAEAWTRGGIDEERAERDRMNKERRAKEDRQHEAFKKMLREGKKVAIFFLFPR